VKEGDLAIPPPSFAKLAKKIPNTVSVCASSEETPGMNAADVPILREAEVRLR
jgi:hypothetical protein